jgi:2',3'-cyclic-nucleotide 2'-phosphodiesterase (5'-nucleotidase family)
VLGGLARRAALVARMRSEGMEVLPVDSGDLFFDPAGSAHQERARLKAALIAKAYRRMGVVAVNVGDADLIQGLDLLREEARQGLPLISANLVDARTGKPVFAPFVVKEVSGMRLAFFGLLGPKLSQALQRALGDSVAVKEPVEAAKEVMESLRGKADHVILLSDLGLSGDRELAKAVPGIQFVLGGHEGRFISAPHQEGTTFMVQSYSKGMYLGKLKVVLEQPGSPWQDEGKGKRIQQEITKIDARINALNAAQARAPREALQRQVEQLTRQKEELQRELAGTGPVTTGNRFLWELDGLGKATPEDSEVSRWIQEAGIDKD